jgi:hypothetical protein
LNEKNKSLENELKDSKDHLNKFSGDKLEKMLNVQMNNLDNFGLDVDFSNISNFERKKKSERKTLFVKPVKVKEVKANIAFLDKEKNYSRMTV